MNKRKTILFLLFFIFISSGILFSEEWFSIIRFNDGKYIIIYSYDIDDIPKGDSITCCLVKPRQSDAKDRLTRTIYPDGRSESYTYDKNDRLLSRTDANGTAVTNVYDAAGRLTDRTVAPAAGVEGPTYETFAYDGLNRLERAENESSITALAYDNAGRLIKETQQIKNGALIAGTYEVNLDYDNNGNKTSLTYPSGKALSITPDALDRIASIQSAGNPVAGYTYEGQDKVKIKTLGSGLKLEAEFDDGKRPTGFKYANAGTSKEIIGQTSTWNKVDLTTSLTRADAGKLSKNFEYDSAYRLRNAAAAQDETAYEIDGADNIKQVTENKKGVAQTVNHDVNNRNQVITLDGQTLTYDANGNLTKMTDGGTITNYIYDYKNQLLRVEGSGTRVEFVYDALGRRVQKKAVYSSSSDVTRYVYDGHQVIEERDSANVLKARYAYGNGIDEPVAIERANTVGAMQSYLPMQDSNGNVIGIADGTGKLVEKVQYDAYGKPTFIYDQEPPQVDQVRVADGKVRIRFSEAVNEATAKDAIALKEGANEISGSFVFEEEGKLAVFAPGSALTANTQYALEITTELEDVSGNKLANAFSQSFTYAGSGLMVYDRVAPQVESVKLVDGKLSVEFTEEIDPATITSAIELTYATGTIAGTSTLEDVKTILFTPSSSLYNSTEYTLAVKSTVMDLSGKALSAYSVKFTYTGKDLLIFQKPDPSEHQESVIGNSTLFQGREFDHETGLYYFRARYLHPKLGRFLQGDPKGYVDSMNPYQAMGNNPVNFSDPYGFSIWEKIDKGISAASDATRWAAEAVVNAALVTAQRGGHLIMALTRPQHFSEPWVTESLNLDSSTGSDVQVDSRNGLAKTIGTLGGDLQYLPANLYNGAKTMMDSDLSSYERREGAKSFVQNITGASLLFYGIYKANQISSPMIYCTKRPTTWDEFQHETKGMFSSRIEAGKVFRSFEKDAIKIEQAGPNTFGLRFHDFGEKANPKGGYLFETITQETNRANMAMPYEWNGMTGIKQWQVQENSFMISGRAASQFQYGSQYVGGARQWYIPNPNNLVEVK